ncbi:hypothetical protein Nepgr_033759 [Nepenthes gracilis]|uniref:Uncharacterized protein n=1 Tax=Nepenthes gracilis TaxID=150966 RepID=A0AAD3TLR2_NEPGR|nr:hypothetical protein Nepgr_033759 [Nepenthes gracilis]
MPPSERRCPKPPAWELKWSSEEHDLKAGCEETGDRGEPCRMGRAHHHPRKASHADASAVRETAPWPTRMPKTTMTRKKNP